MDLVVSELPPNNNETVNIKSILKSNIKNNNINKESNTKRVSYDDILAKMGMYVDNGKLHLVEKCSSSKEPYMQCSKVKCSRIQESLKQHSASTNPNYLQQKPLQQKPLQQQSLQNSYIYNKHFKNELQNNEPKILVPTTHEEYKEMMIKKILENKIQQLRVKRMKSTQLIMPTENIHIAPERSSTFNRFFQFSQR